MFGTIPPPFAYKLQLSCVAVMFLLIIGAVYSRHVVQFYFEKMLLLQLENLARVTSHFALYAEAIYQVF